MTRLYIVEGLPCSGKSTTAKQIANLLEQSGKKVYFFDEGSGKHPADYEYHAYITDEQLKGLEEAIQVKIKQCATENKDGYIVALSEFTKMEQKQLLAYKIYDFLPWETEKPLMLDCWKCFVKKAIQEDSVYVFNCVFLQNPMCETMMRFNLPKEQIFEYIEQINTIISPLEPIIVYLENDDVEKQIQEAAKEREGWLDAVVDYHVNGGYGKSISACGFDGYISCLKERQKRELEYLEKSKVRRIIIKNAHRNWKQAYDIIADGLV
jgi:ABC-type oligopeptide transport system ATPase subunit